ncbi:MAG: glycoside hydrolase family 9 protein [bacterium]|nr:glycoside hydrolase family 9 protein [bacterium]
MNRWLLTRVTIKRFIILSALLACARPVVAQRCTASWVSATCIALVSPQQRADAGWINPRNFRVLLGAATVTPARVTCETRLADVLPRGWPYQPIYRHILYLHLAVPAPGACAVAVQATNGVLLATLAAWQTDATRCVQVDSIGYAPDDTGKIALVGDWLGTGGALALASKTGSFSLVRLPDGSNVVRGVLQCLASNDVESGAAVYAADFSVWRATGSYYIVVDEVGRSLVFQIAPRAHEAVLVALLRGLYQQRCGTAMGPPYTAYAHGICHTGLALLVDFRDSMDAVMKDLPARVVRPEVRMDCRGGWHDAGDYDRAGWHIFTVMYLLDAYTLAPSNFYDGQSNIPESGNGIPDILDEAAWGLQWFVRMQDTNDGGLYYRVDTAQYGFGLPQDDHQQLFVMQKYPKYTMYAAAGLAQAARVLAPYVERSRRTMLIERARLAYAYGVQHGAPAEARSAAAAELYLTTGDAVYHRDFLAGALRTSWSYAVAPSNLVDTAAQAACKQHFVTMADNDLREVQRHAYPCFTDGRAQGLGISAGLAVAACLRAYLLTRTPCYRDAARIAAHVQLGLNALGRSWITGIGVHPPEKMTHAPSLQGGRGMVPGLPIFGPRRLAADTGGTHARLLWQVSEPKPYPWMRLWAPVAEIPQINEFTVRDMAQVIVGYAGLF